MEFNLDLVEGALCRKSFYYFVQQFWDVIIPETPLWNWHIEYLCSELQVIAERVKNRDANPYDLLINISPGTTKSTLVTIMFPVYCWILDDTIRSLTASYSISLSNDHSAKSRDIIKSERFKRFFPDVRIRKDFDNKSHYKSRNGGERFATSVGATATGFHAHLIIIDDPLNPKEAASDIMRDAANDFMDRTLPTRKIDKDVTPTIMVMQRLHENDPSGNWLNRRKDKIKHICLPGEISTDINPPELAEKYVGGYMDAQRLGEGVLKDLRVQLGSYGYAGQIMQIPAPEGGGIWKVSYIVPVRRHEIPRLRMLGTDWDTAYTAKDENSASAWVTAGMSANAMYITDLGAVHQEFPQLVATMTRKQAPHYVEGKASGKSLVQTLKNNGIPAIEVSVVKGDKIARTTMATPYAEAGLVFIAEDLLDTLYNHPKQGILKFPNNFHDDLNDALVQAIHRVLGGPKVFTF